jgi:DNA-binding transcriptional LysR family regulator
VGIARLMSYQVAAAVGAGQLQIVLEEFEPPALPVHVLYRGGRQAGANIRAFVDIAGTQLRSALAR